MEPLRSERQSKSITITAHRRASVHHVKPAEALNDTVIDALQYHQPVL